MKAFLLIQRYAALLHVWEKKSMKWRLNQWYAMIDSTNNTVTVSLPLNAAQNFEAFVVVCRSKLRSLGIRNSFDHRPNWLNSNFTHQRQEIYSHIPFPWQCYRSILERQELRSTHWNAGAVSTFPSLHSNELFMSNHVPLIHLVGHDSFFDYVFLSSRFFPS